MAEEDEKHWSEPMNPLASVRNPKLPDFSVMDVWQFTCGSRAVAAGGISYVVGGAMGLVFQNYDTLTLKDDAPVRQQFRQAIRHAWQGAKPWAKNFAVFGLLYTGFECAAEHARGRSDVYNHIIAGCATGAGLAWQTGPTGMGAACVGMGLFSLATESYFNRDH